MPIFFFNGAKCPPDNFYVTCLLREKSVTVTSGVRFEICFENYFDLIVVDQVKDGRAVSSLQDIITRHLLSCQLSC